MAKKQAKKSKQKKVMQTETKTCFCEKMLCFFRVLLRIALITMIIIGIVMIIKGNKNNHVELKRFEALEIFSQIDDLAHEQYAEMLATGNPHGFTKSDEFLAIDKTYHNTNTFEEKWKAAEKMDTFCHEIVDRLHEINGLESTGDVYRDKKFRELDLLFHALAE